MNDASWTLRPAVRADRDPLFALHRSTMGPYVDAVWGWDDAEQAAYFDRRFRPGAWQVVQAAGEDVGLLVVVRTPAAIDVASIQIRPDRQGGGLGSSLLTALMEEARATARPLTLGVLNVNVRARALYDRLGFRAVGRDEVRTLLRWEPD